VLLFFQTGSSKIGPNESRRPGRYESHTARAGLVPTRNPFERRFDQSPDRREFIGLTGAHFELFVFGLVLDAAQAFEGRAIVRQLEDAAQQNRYILEFDPGALFDLRNDEVAQVRIGLPKSKWNSTLVKISPYLSEGTDLLLEGPRVARLLIELPIGFGDRGGSHQAARMEII
jgi:hypothetical protein